MALIQDRAVIDRPFEATTGDGERVAVTDTTANDGSEPRLTTAKCSACGGFGYRMAAGQWDEWLYFETCPRCCGSGGRER